MLYDLGPRARPVYAALLDQVRSGALAPGTRLPPHTQLAQTFGVAPLTMRQVLARLELEGVLVRERGRGTFVRASQEAHVVIATADGSQRTALLDQVHRTGRHAVVAATPAEGLAALARERSIGLLVVHASLPTPRLAMAFVRAVRRRHERLTIAVLEPTRRQRRRLEQTVAPPFLILADPINDLAQALERVAAAQPVGGGEPLATAGQLDARVPDLLHRYHTIQLRGDRVAAHRLLVDDGLAAGVPLSDLYLGVLEPAQFRLGQLWQANEITAAREHLATAVTASVMAQLMASAPRSPGPDSCVVVGCVEGELHDLGARMVADLLELDGIGVRFLGANVPTNSLVRITQEERPRLLVLSTTLANRLGTVREAIAAVRRGYGPDLPILVGGQAVEGAPERARQVGADVAASDVHHTLQAVRRVLTPRRAG